MRIGWFVVLALLAMASTAQAATTEAGPTVDATIAAADLAAATATHAATATTTAAAHGAADLATRAGAALLDAASTVTAGVLAAVASAATLAATLAAAVAILVTHVSIAMAQAASLGVATAAAAAATVAAAAADVLARAAGLVLDVAHGAAGAPPGRHAALASGAGGAATGAVAMQAWHRLLDTPFMARLYSRLDPEDILSHDGRRAIYEHVKATPGAHVSAIADATELGWGTTVYHLDRLAEADLLTSKRHGNHRCYFVNGGTPQPAQRAISALKHERARDVAAYVKENPSANQKAVGGALDMSPALVSWHVRRLVEAGVIKKERVGRGTALYLRKEAQQAVATTA